MQRVIHAFKTGAHYKRSLKKKGKYFIFEEALNAGINALTHVQ